MTIDHPNTRTALAAVRQQIRDAETEFSLPADTVRLIAVSKTKPASQILAAIDAGQRDFGENYLDEAIPKIEQLAEKSCRWHFIGNIQSNKTRHVATYFDWAHCIDREKIALRLSRQRPDHLRALNVCIQVNIDNEVNKSGVFDAETLALADQISQLPNLRLRGLMAIPSPGNNFEAQRKPFARMHRLFEQLRRTHPSMDTLSMGMSADMRAAIAEGATMVRVGTAIFGARPQK